MRILFNGEEITKKTERLDSDVFAMTYTTTDFIYIASDFPFNHLFFKLGAVANEEAATMKVEYWGNSQWNEVVELRDDTSALSNDGFIEFTPDKDTTWNREELSSVVGVSRVIYDKYWLRISFNIDLTAAVELSYVGHKFTDDTDLFSEYPIFNSSEFLTAFKSGKTSWEEQHIKAAELIVMDLMKKSVILGPEQILERRKFIDASSCKVAEIIFTAFGNDYLEQRRLAAEYYSRRLDLSQYAIDADDDGLLDPVEVKTRQGWLSR